MGIKLDWEIENERERVPNMGEDPEFARQRRRARLRALGIVALFLGLIGLVVGLVVLRLRQSDAQIEQLLRDTVAAEVTALRIGNRDDFLALQRSATNDWILRQSAEFDRYEMLKQNEGIVLTGRVIDATVDGYNGRVVVEELVSGIPFARVWFYWRYDDGWRHVPPDYLFWGASETLATTRLDLRYRELDDMMAAVVSTEITAWLETACAAFNCGDRRLTIDIVPDPELLLGWAPGDAWVLTLPSPLTSLARLDQPFDPAQREQAANLLAERIVAEALATEPLYPSDAYYFRQAAISWLVGRFLQRETNSFLMESLAQVGGLDAVGTLISSMPANGDVRLVAQAAGVADVAQAALDWRDYLTWRLRLEDDFIAARDSTNFFSLYDTTSDPLRVLAQGRFDAGQGAGQVVVSVAQGLDTSSTPILRTLAQNAAGDQAEVVFRLVDGIWKRAN